MERNVTGWELARYLEKKRCGGRGLFARWLDYVLLRVVFFACAYLFFLERIKKRGPVVALSVIALLLFMLLLRVLRELSMERFLRREQERVRGVLLTDRLLLLDEKQGTALCRPLCAPEETPLLLSQAGAASADALLALVRANRHKGKLAVFCCGGFDASATAFAARACGQLRLASAKALLDEARAQGLLPTAPEIRACLAAECAAEKQRQKRRVLRPPAPHAAKQYFFAALLLVIASFFTRYALYYRLLAGLCSTIATLGITLRAARTNAA